MEYIKHVVPPNDVSCARSLIIGQLYMEVLKPWPCVVYYRDAHRVIEMEGLAELRTRLRTYLTSFHSLRPNYLSSNALLHPLKAEMAWYQEEAAEVEINSCTMA
ncbi:hypothetical protein ACFE04_026734 [Oxalis oulophora]